MNAIEKFTAGPDHAPEAFAAELTEAVFPVALRYGAPDSWLDLELDLWHVLAETVEKWNWKSPPDDSPGKFEVWRTGLLAELAHAAYHTALRHGTQGSRARSPPARCRRYRTAYRRESGPCGRTCRCAGCADRP